MEKEETFALLRAAALWMVVFPSRNEMCSLGISKNDVVQYCDAKNTSTTQNPPSFVWPRKPFVCDLVNVSFYPFYFYPLSLFQYIVVFLVRTCCV